MFMILINLAAFMAFWWLIARLFLQAGTTITDKIKVTSSRRRPSGSVLLIQNHPIADDISSAIRNAPYGFAHSLSADRCGVTVRFWNDDGSICSRHFPFSSYAEHAPARDSELNLFTAALKNRIPYGNHYTLTNHMVREDSRDSGFRLDHVTFDPGPGLPV